MESFFADIQSNPEIDGLEIISPYDAGQRAQVAESGKIAYAELNFSDRDYDDYVVDADVIRALPTWSMLKGWAWSSAATCSPTHREFSSEYIGIVAAIIILLIAFGSVIAMGLPIITALFGIGAGVALVALSTVVSWRCPTSRSSLPP